MATDLTKVSAMVAEKIQKGVPFTAWIITSDLRKKGESANHDDVKGEVHRQFKAGQMSNYNRDSIGIPGKTNKCWVYYPAALDPNDQAFLDYLFANGPEVSAVASASAPVAALPASTSSDDEEEEEDDEEDDNI